MSAAGGRHEDRDEHRDGDELAVGWALHALEPEDEDRFAAHLATCPSCARTAAETAEVMAAMAADLPPAEPSEGLRDRLRAAVEVTEQLRPQQPVRSALPPSVPAAPRPALGSTGVRDLRAPRSPRVPDRRPAWRRVLPTALVAAAVAAVLSLSAWNVVVTGDRDAAQATAAQQEQMLDALLAPGRATIAPVEADGHTVGTVVARADEVQVVATGLPVNDSHDTTYVVWGMGGEVPVPLGEFDVVTPEMDLRTVGSAATGLDEFSRYAISIEPGRQAPSYPTEVVAEGQVTS